MAKATFVKSARKDNPSAGIKKGDSYYWWAFMVGGRGGPKRYSKTKPTRSQLTSSNFLSQIYEMEDRNFSGESPEDLQNERDEMVSDLGGLRDECEESLGNMPEGLREGDTGQLLQARIDGIESTISEFESVDLDYDEPETVEPDADESESDCRERYLAEWCDDKRIELSDVSFEYE